jgi:hypothetical protein
MSTPPLPVDAHTSIRPSGGSYKASSIKEGFICAGIWALVSAVFASGIQLWGYYVHPLKSINPLEEWAELIGGIVGQFVLMAICLSSVGVHRRWKNVTSFILLDWRWWLGLVLLSVLLQNPPLAWVWVGLIYQVRLRMKPKFPTITAL